MRILEEIKRKHWCNIGARNPHFTHKTLVFSATNPVSEIEITHTHISADQAQRHMTRGDTVDRQIHSEKQMHWWKSIRFKKDSLFSTGKQQGSEVKGHMGERIESKLLLLNTADGLDLRGLAVGAKLLEVFVLPTVTITLHDILVSTITRVLVAHKSVGRA